MTRTELCTSETINMFLYVYSVFKKMQEKYADDVENNRAYDFSFFNYMGTGQTVVMRPNLFAVYEDDAGEDSCPVFEISKVQRENAVWVEFCLTDSSFSWYNGKYNKDLVLVVGDHEKNWDKRYVDCREHSSPEEIFEEYGEEYFFQQLTVQNIIPYEQFQNEVYWYFKHLVHNMLDESDILFIEDLSNFNIKTLEGFRII